MVIYPWFYLFSVGDLFFLTLNVDFIERYVGSVCKDFVWKYDNVIIVFFCFLAIGSP